MSTIELTSSDGHKLAAWKGEPGGTPRGAVVIIQEIFGVNSHIRAVVDAYAANGYVAIAPAFFDRLERGYETGYGADDIAAGRLRVGQLDWENTFADLAAAVAAARDIAGGARVGAIGFCWGGTVAWRAASRLGGNASGAGGTSGTNGAGDAGGLACAVAYYGGMIPNFLDDEPKAPVLLHFGEEDQTPPPETAKAIAERYPDLTEVHLYPAGHGFNCDQRGSWNAAAAASARDRTLAFLARHLDG